MYSGRLLKLKGRRASSGEVSYQFCLESTGGVSFIDANALVGKNLSLEFLGEISCTHCGAPTPKSYGQGLCFNCLQSLAKADQCLVKPEQCHYAMGTCRQPRWGEKHCLQDHFIYLSETSGVKVGVTRQTNLPSRWIDQGAVQAMAIARVPDRKTAGQWEVQIAQFLADKTNWRKMLEKRTSELDLHAVYDEVKEKLELPQLIAKDQTEVVHFTYPRPEVAFKMKSLKLEEGIEGQLLGIKGQYLYFEQGVVNVRKYGGYHVQLRAS